MTEEMLLEALQKCPKEGIRMLTQMYGGLVYGLTSRRLQGRLPREDIEECVSDIFLELYQNREQIDLEKGSIKMFLLLIAKRRAIKYYERRGRLYDTVPLDSAEGLSLTAQTDVEGVVEQKEESRRLMHAIQMLGEPVSTILIQKYYYGMTAKEIGEGLGTAAGTVMPWETIKSRRRASIRWAETENYICGARCWRNARIIGKRIIIRPGKTWDILAPKQK